MGLYRSNIKAISFSYYSNIYKIIQNLNKTVMKFKPDLYICRDIWINF